MIWFIEIPIIFFAIIALLIGSMEVGPFLRGTGIFLLIVGLIGFFFGAKNDDEEDQSLLYAGAALGAILGMIALIVGAIIGERSIYEVIFK